MSRILLLAPLLCLAVTADAATAVDEARRAAIRAELSAIADEVKLNRAFNLLHELVRPSVVSIRISEVRWRYDRIRDVEVGEGSGFVFATDDQTSYILTNAHVVLQMNQDQEFIRSRAGKPVWYDRIRILTGESESIEATPVGADIETDLAVLAVARPRMPAITWGDSDQAQVGDYVAALGFPMRVGYSATFGHISATDKSTEIYRREQGYESFLQTDAAINPGNSGGPLVNLRGAVIGVNASILSRTGGSVGIGFAIPSRLAQRVADDLKRFGEVHRPMLGIQMDDLEAAEAERSGCPNRQAVKVTLVLPGSPAEEAGLQDGDLIMAVDGIEVAGVQQLRARIAGARIDQPLTLDIWRGGAKTSRPVLPISREDLNRRLAEKAQVRGGDEARWPGYGLALGKDHLRGLVVKEVVAGSPAARAGLTAGDRLLRLYDGQVLSKLEDAKPLDRLPEMVLLVYRDGHPYLVRLRREP